MAERHILYQSYTFLTFSVCIFSPLLLRLLSHLAVAVSYRRMCLCFAARWARLPVKKSVGSILSIFCAYSLLTRITATEIADEICFPDFVHLISPLAFA